MAEDIAVSFLLEKVSELLREKARELSRSPNEVAGKIGRIEDLLKMLPSPVNNSRDRLTSDYRVRLQRDTNAIIYRFAIVKENFGIVVATQGGWFLRFFKKLVCVRIDLREIYTEIIEIENEINHLLEIDKELSRRNGAGQEESSRAEYVSSHTIYEDFVGMADEINELRSYIMKPEYRAIGICGMGGLGKTAVAKRLFNDHQIKNHFDAVAWVHVSQDFQPIMIFEHLYMQLYPRYRGRILDIDEAELSQRVYRIQQESRCLIVLDGMWSSDAWESLRIAFPSGETGSKILITTRVKHVVETVEIVAARRYIHKLRCLTPDESSELFLKSVLSTAVPGQSAFRLCQDEIKS